VSINILWAYGQFYKPSFGCATVNQKCNPSDAGDERIAYILPRRVRWKAKQTYKKDGFLMLNIISLNHSNIDYKYACTNNQ